MEYSLPRITKGEWKCDVVYSVYKATYHLMLFPHHKILVMDNAHIHTNGKAEIGSDLLWNIKQDDEPLHVAIVYLPTCSLELNPI